MLVGISISILVFFFMEFAAWFTHKYIMHGFLWVWHESHHKKHNHAIEKNDWFAVVFSLPAIVLIVLGFELEGIWSYLKWVGFGITAYGIFYLLFHDILVHRRVKHNVKPKTGYLKRMMNAHYVHHKKHTKEGCEAFGFLYAPKKYENRKTINKKSPA